MILKIAEGILGWVSVKLEMMARQKSGTWVQFGKRVAITWSVRFTSSMVLFQTPAVLFLYKMYWFIMNKNSVGLLTVDASILCFFWTPSYRHGYVYLTYIFSDCVTVGTLGSEFMWFVWVWLVTVRLISLSSLFSVSQPGKGKHGGQANSGRGQKTDEKVLNLLDIHGEAYTHISIEQLAVKLS